MNTPHAAETVWPFSGPLEGGGTVTHDVHVFGKGPPILLLQEMPGIGPQTLDLARRLNAAGFCVYLPHLLGTFGKVTFASNVVRVMCVRREFNVFLRGRQSPIAAWMRALVAEISARENGAQVGVIGMCLTGSFALALMAEDAVAGAVASQPALPAFGGDALHMTADEARAARAGMAAKGPGLAMRYAGDSLVPDRLRDAFVQAFGDDLDWQDYAGRKHSLLTLHFHEPAYQRMEAYFLARFGLSSG